jgi:SH3-like domain-containing protein
LKCLHVAKKWREMGKGSECYTWREVREAEGLCGFVEEQAARADPQRFVKSIMKDERMHEVFQMWVT